MSCNRGAWPETRPRERQATAVAAAPAPGSPFARPNLRRRYSSSAFIFTMPWHRSKNDLLPTPHMEVHAELDCLHGGLEAQRSEAIHDIVHRRGVRAEIVVVVFEPRRPIRSEGPFDAGAGGPSEAIAQSFEIEWDARHDRARAAEIAGETVLAARPGNAAPGVEQPSIG